MTGSNQVVVHFLDGRLVKGTTIDFNPTQAMFHVVPASGGAPIEITCRTLKAIFFVHSLSGRPKARAGEAGFEAPRHLNAQGKKVAVLFQDGELLCGYSLTYDRGREGFFVFPADPRSNNQRVYVVGVAVSDVKVGPEAETFARRYSAEKRRTPVTV